MSIGSRSNPDCNDERMQIQELLTTLRSGMPSISRRDMLRMSAIAGGALALSRGGTSLASPGGTARSAVLYQDDEIETDVSITVPFDPYGQQVTLDPHRTVNWGPFWVMFPNVWGGLLRYDENGKVALDLADSYEISEDGLTYTFAIRSDAAFASGNPVTAEAFVESWKRALDPDRLSPMANFMSHVAGYRRYVAKQDDEIGFRAIDESTVEVEFSTPFTFLPSLMASFVWSVIDPAILAEYGDDEFVLNGAGTGPWQFSEFDPSTNLVMEPNTFHYDGNSPSISRIVWPFVTGPEAAQAALDMYIADEAVSADVPMSLKSTVEEDSALAEELVRISPEGNVTSIGMDFLQAPFDDVRVRRAVAMSIDKDELANAIWNGTWSPASSFTPPVLATIANYEAPEGIAFDPEGARALLVEAGYASGADLPQIVYRQPLEESDAEKARARALLDMIELNSGIVIEHDTSLSRQQISDLDLDNGGRQFDVIGWWNLWETPHILSEIGSPESPYMRGLFNWDATVESSGEFEPGSDAETFESLTSDADLEADEAARNALFQEAETLLLQNAVYVPLGYWIQMYVQKPYLTGTRQGPWTGRLPVWFDKDVVVTSQPE